MPAEISINYWAVLVAAIANMALGFIWYSKAVFGKAWMKMLGMTDKKMQEAQKKGMAKILLIAFIGALVMSYVLAHFVDYLEATDIISGIQLGLWLWLGIVAVILLGTILWEGKPLKLYLINAGYWLVTLVVMSVILAIWP